MERALRHGSEASNKAVHADDLRAVQIAVPLRCTLRQFGQRINRG